MFDDHLTDNRKMCFDCGFFSCFSILQIQIWLAMAYEANNRHADCIALYKQLERHHPSVSIRRQASELRYILQAPKLKITQEEMVTIPLIGSTYDRYVVWFFFFFFFFGLIVRICSSVFALLVLEKWIMQARSHVREFF